MNKENNKLSRRGFLKISGVAVGGLLSLDNKKLLDNFKNSENKWPELILESLPEEMKSFKSIYQQIPQTEIRDNGWLTYSHSSETAHILDTETNRNQINDEILTNVGGLPIETLVILQKSSNKYIQNYDTTSHFLVEDKRITQTKFPSENGKPQMARGIKYSDPKVKNRFANALRDLTWKKDYINTFYPPLLKMFKHEPDIATFRRAMVVKIKGEIGDKIEEPSEKLMANLLSVLRSLKKYDLSAWNIVDNREIYGNKRAPEKDVGVKTTAEIRHYLGLLALIDGTQEEKELVFGEFKRPGEDNFEAAKRYFKANRDYLKKVLTGKEFQDWDVKTKYWFFMDWLEGNKPMPIADNFIEPIDNDSGGGYNYLDKVENLFTGEKAGYHTGHDYNIGSGNGDEGELFRCIGNGRVVYTGKTTNGMGNTIIVRHRLPDGSEVYSRYGHTKDIFVKIGDDVEIGQNIGTIGRTGYEDSPNFYAHLHLDIAYSKTYEERMANRPEYYDNDSELWIKRQFIDPHLFLSQYPKSTTPELEQRECSR